jgi:hypothetical protein
MSLEVAVPAAHEVLMEVGDNILLTVGDQQGDQKIGKKI